MLPAPDTPQDQLYVWRVVFPIARAIALFLVPVRIEGIERIPRGAALIVANHASWKDPPLLTFALDRSVRFFAKEELFRIPILGGALRLAGNFGVRRGEADRRALVTALRVLAAGLPLGFFPEGHRSESGAVIRARPFTPSTLRLCRCLRFLSTFRARGSSSPILRTKIKSSAATSPG